MESHQTGIMDYWDLWFRPMPPQCDGKPQIANKGPKRNSSLSFKNLTGAFIVIALGLSLSLLTFLCEQIIFITNRRRKRTRNNKITGINKLNKYPQETRKCPAFIKKLNRLFFLNLSQTS